MLRGKLRDNQEDWDLQLQPCMMAYRSSVHESTGETPNMLMLGREIEVPLDAMTEPTPDTLPFATEYAFALQQRLASAHEVSRRHLGKAAERQKRNYDKRVSSKPFRVGNSVWLHKIRRKKGRNPKLDCPWEGPYLVVSVLSDVTYRIQRSRRAKPKVIHADRIKPYLGPALKSWIVEREGTVMPVESHVVRAGEVGPVSDSVEAVLGEGMLNGSDATKSLNPAQCSSPEVMTMAEDPESDNESFGSDTDTVILPHTQTATPDDRPLSETEGFDAVSNGHLSQAVRSRYGRQWRPPNYYGD